VVVPANDQDGSGFNLAKIETISLVFIFG